jgi:hypothetical protein
VIPSQYREDTEKKNEKADKRREYKRAEISRWDSKPASEEAERSPTPRREVLGHWAAATLSALAVAQSLRSPPLRARSNLTRTVPVSG